MNGMILKMEIFHLFILFRSSLIFFMCRKKRMKIYTAKCWIVMVSEMNVAWWGYVVRILILNIASGKNNVKWIISQFKKKKNDKGELNCYQCKTLNFLTLIPASTQSLKSHRHFHQISAIPAIRNPKPLQKKLLSTFLTLGLPRGRGADARL